MNVEALRERTLQLRNVGNVRKHAQFDLRIVRRTSVMPGAAMKAVRISRPSFVRIGMFCRLGSDEASRPSSWTPAHSSYECVPCPCE